MHPSAHHDDHFWKKKENLNFFNFNSIFRHVSSSDLFLDFVFYITFCNFFDKNWEKMNGEV